MRSTFLIQFLISDNVSYKKNFDNTNENDHKELLRCLSYQLVVVISASCFCISCYCRFVLLSCFVERGFVQNFV